jgi:hypothetical protein
VVTENDMPAGSYALFLNMPDASEKLSQRPEYSIRLANENAWEAATGYNALNATISIN